jgi:hypothetical protein
MKIVSDFDLIVIVELIKTTDIHGPAAGLRTPDISSDRVWAGHLSDGKKKALHLECLFVQGLLYSIKKIRLIRLTS